MSTYLNTAGENRCKNSGDFELPAELIEAAVRSRMMFWAWSRICVERWPSRINVKRTWFTIVTRLLARVLLSTSWSADINWGRCWRNREPYAQDGVNEWTRFYREEISRTILQHTPELWNTEIGAIMWMKLPHSHQVFHWRSYMGMLYSDPKSYDNQGLLYIWPINQYTHFSTLLINLFQFISQRIRFCLTFRQFTFFIFCLLIQNLHNDTQHCRIIQITC